MSEPPPANLFSQLEHLEGYRRYFTDPSAWRPSIEKVCRRQGLSQGGDIRIGVPGTCPTFIVDDRWVIKFYGRLFDCEQAFSVELELGKWARSLSLPVPEIIAAGKLFPSRSGWRWPYLVFQYLPGVSVGQVAEEIGLEDRLSLARWMAEFTRRMHNAPVPASEIFQPTWKSFVDLLERQRSGCQASFREWGCLPEHLFTQLEDFLLPVNELANTVCTPQIIHADLTADHVLGSLEDGRWKPTALIDFGDAMIGNLYYELVALHLDMFKGDKRLLSTYLDAYGLADSSCRRLPVLAMNMALLHRFNVLGPVFERQPTLREVPTLAQLARSLWES